MPTAVFSVIRLVSPLPVHLVPPSVQLQVTCPDTSIRALLVGIADTISGLINPTYPAAAIYIPAALFGTLVTWLAPVPFVPFNVNVKYTVNNGKWSVNDVYFSAANAVGVQAAFSAQLSSVSADALDVMNSVKELNALVGQTFGGTAQATIPNPTKTRSGSGAPPACDDPHLNQQSK